MRPAVIAPMIQGGYLMLPVRVILHPTDFSERAGHAFDLACSLARDYGARLVLVHVKPPQMVYGEMVPLPPEPSDVRQTLQERLSQLRPPDPNMKVERYLREGDPAAEILRLVQETQCDLIVLGTHGRTGLGRLLMGSVA